MKIKLAQGIQPYFFGLAGAGLVVAAVPAFAQETASLEEIVVTAQRTESSLQKTPIAVTAYDAAALEKRGVTDLASLGTFTPSLTVMARPGGGSGRAAFSMRGMSVSAENSSAAVGVYVDDVYFPALQGNSLGLLDTARVEVLRGPQGTLFGRNTISGAVQYVSVKPQDKFEGYATATVGNLDREHLEAVLNLPLVDTLAMRVSVSKDMMGGYVHDTYANIKRGEVRTDLGRVQLRWTPSDTLTIDLKGEGSKQRTNGRALEVTAVNENGQFAGLAGLGNAYGSQYLALLFAGTPPFPPGSPPSPPYVGPLTALPQPPWSAQFKNQLISTPGSYRSAGLDAPDFFDSKQRNLTLNIGYDLTDAIKFKSISAYFRTESQIASDTDQTPLPVLGGTRGVDTSKAFSQEFQLNGRFIEDRLNITSGLFYYDSESTRVGQLSLIGPTNFPLPVDDTRSEVTSKAIYAQGTFKITEPLSVTLGLRYTKEDIDEFSTKPANPFLAPFSVSNSFSDTSPHVGVNYQLTEDAMLYIKASKGFRAGGITLSSNLPGNGLAFKPETAWTYEAGARLEFLNRSLRINPTVFHTKWTDIQFNKIFFGANSSIAITSQNAGDATLNGFELETQWAATSKLLFTASGSYLDASYDRVDQFFKTNGQPGLDLTTKTPLQQAPEYKFSVGAQYTQPLSNGANVVASADYGWTDKQESGTTETTSMPLPSFGLLNGRLAYNSADNVWSVALYGTNLLDEYYYTGGSPFAEGATVLSDAYDVGRPREYGLTLRFNFK